MRCIKMKVIDVLLFSFNLMAVKSVIPPNFKTSQPVDNGNLNKFERVCPDLWKIIQSNNLTEFINCQNVSKTNKLVNTEEVLQSACFLAKNMMEFICNHKLNTTKEHLKLPENSPICPFQFSQSLELGHLVKELTIKEHCEKVCIDLYENRIQCVILKKLNSYLKNYEEQTRRLDLVLSDEKKSAITTSISKSNKIDDKFVKPKTNKETTTKGKMETTSNKEAFSSAELLSTVMKSNEPKAEKSKLKEFEPEKPNIISSHTPENIEMSKEDLKIPEEENKDFKIKNDYLNFKDTSENNNMQNPAVNSPKGELNRFLNFQRYAEEDEDRKVEMPSFNQKELNPNDGFLQAEDSHFFFYFIMVSSIIVIGYIGFHNKNKILAYALEGTSGRRSRRRPNPARYRKLETNLEEAISSNASETVASSVVY